MARKDERLSDEIQFHIEQQTAKNIRAGMSPDEARRAALVKFGGVEQTREATRDEYRGAVVQDFLRDMRIGLRMLARVPAFAATTILTLGLGIGASAAMFSVVQGVLLKPLPYPQSDRIVRLFQVSKTGTRNTNVSGPNFDDWRSGTHSFAAMAEMAQWGRVPVAGQGEPLLITSTAVTQPFFDVMRVEPAIGRRFLPSEYVADAGRAAIVSADFWHVMMNDAPLAGQTVTFNGEPYAVVGIMPKGFDYPGGTGVWIPHPPSAPTESRTAHNYQAIARLADGVTLRAANTEISSLSRQLKVRYGDDTTMSDAEAATLLDVETSGSRLALQMLFGASALLLLVACTNVSNMLVVRASARRREFAVQLAIGATTGRITRQLLAETLVLCLGSALIGVTIAAFTVRAFAAIGPANAPRLSNVAVDWTSIAFACGVAALASAVLGVITALGTRSVRISEALADSTRTGSGSARQVRVRQLLIVMQVALTLVLLSGAGLLGRSFLNVMAVDTGFRTDDALIADVEMPWSNDASTIARRVTRQDEILARLGALPGVSGVGLISDFPIGESSFRNGGFVEMSRPDEFKSYAEIQALGAAVKPRQGYAEYRLASAGYFAAMGIPLLKGRLIDDTDGPGAPEVAVISKSLADAKWPKQDPIGRYVQYGNMDGDMNGIRIVGVVGDVREATREAAIRPTLYAAFRQRPLQASGVAIIVRGPAPASISDTVRRLIHEVDPAAPVELRTVTGALDRATGSRRFNLWLIGAFSATALLLSTLGVYGLVAFSVAQRTREMGIRMALGARPASLVTLVVTQGARLALIGGVIGLAGALGLTTWVKGMLFHVGASDPAVLGAVFAVVMTAALVASYLPARRILRQTPGRTLRDV